MTDKKQIYRLIHSICELNENQWDNKAGSYDDKLEASMQIEEALEGFDMLYFSKDLISEFSAPRDFSAIDPKDVSRAIIRSTGQPDLKDVDRFDKALDAWYILIGSMHKLGLTPEQMIEGLQVVHNANMQKTIGKDENGKTLKPDGFINPEPELQEILDARI